MRNPSSVIMATCLTCLGFAPSQSVAPEFALLNSKHYFTLSTRDLGVNEQIWAQADSSNSLIDLGLGNQGEEVKKLQIYLKQLGYFAGEADGIYGEATKVAVAQFQKRNGLLPDGLVGEKTWQLLQAKRADKGDSSEYDRYMREGYQANARKNYRKALKFFQQALSERPDDPYAKNAIANVESYIDIHRGLRWNSEWLLLALFLSIAGISGGLLTLRNKSKKAQQRLASESLPNSVRESGEHNFVEAEVTPAENKSKSTDSNNHVHSHDTNGNGNPRTSTINSNTLAAENTRQNNESLAIKQTTRLSKVDSINELIGDLAQSDPLKRRKAIWELAQRADSRAVQPLVELMIDCDSKERSLVLEALSQISSRTIKPLHSALAMSLQDDNPEVRKNAIRDLTNVYELVTQISRLLSHAAEDSDAEVQETAKWALKKLNLSSGFERLSEGRDRDVSS